MGQKQSKNFSFPIKCLGSNFPNFMNKIPLKIQTSNDNVVFNASINFKEIPAYQNQSPLPSLTFLTYNIWFEMQNQTNRIPCLFKLMQKSNADFICLQQVTRSFVEQLQKQNWVQYYHVSGYQMHSYDTLILSKYGCKFKRIKYNKTGMARSLIIGQTVLNGKVFAIATSHFQSLNNSQIRIEQLNTAFDHLNQYQDAILMGDFNFDSTHGVQEKAIPENWKDLYLEVHNKTDYTMPQTDRYNAWRPDRMLLKSKNYKIEWIQRIGNFTIAPFEDQKIEDIKKDGIVQTPSDHLGLASRIVLIKNQKL